MRRLLSVVALCVASIIGSSSAGHAATYDPGGGGGNCWSNWSQSQSRYYCA